MFWTAKSTKRPLIVQTAEECPSLDQLCQSKRRGAPLPSEVLQPSISFKLSPFILANGLGKIDYPRFKRPRALSLNHRSHRKSGGQRSFAKLQRSLPRIMSSCGEVTRFTQTSALGSRERPLRLKVRPAMVWSHPLEWERTKP
ncbi:MAG: hypothetical protein ACTS6P_01380 [Candidatus Hodgkinia cicadicola]